MPELPEVETMARDLNMSLSALRIDEVHIYDDRVLNGISKASFKKKLTGRTFVSSYRRGKAIIFEMDNGLYVVVQVKMTGHFIYGPNQRETPDFKETKIVFKLSNGRYLNYNDHRLFGWFFVVKNLKEIAYLENIGPEPLENDFSIEWLKKNLKKRTAPIKQLLMNQHFVAGIGNIYASEILFLAGINPRKKANTLTFKQIQALHISTIDILQESIILRGTSMRNYRDASGQKGEFMNRIKVYGKAGSECVECSSKIKKIVQGGRSTFYCTKCQKN